MKHLLTALLFIACTGCVSTKAYLYEPVPTKTFSIQTTAPNDSIKGIFENTFKAELLKAGYSVADQAPVKLSIAIVESNQEFSRKNISSVLISLADPSGKIFIQLDYSQSTGGDQTAVEIARDTARKFVAKLKSS